MSNLENLDDSVILYRSKKCFVDQLQINSSPNQCFVLELLKNVVINKDREPSFSFWGWNSRSRLQTRKMRELLVKTHFTLLDLHRNALLIQGLYRFQIDVKTGIVQYGSYLAERTAFPAEILELWH